MNIVGMLRKIIKMGVVRSLVLKKPAVRYCVDNELLPSVLIRTPSGILRKMFNLPELNYQPQLNQDIFALLMNQFREGFFLEIGANDGFTLSNTVYLEEKFGWKGILVEANPKYMHSLAGRKNSVIVNKAVSLHKGKAEFVDAGLYGGLKSSLDATLSCYVNDAQCIEVDCMSLSEILDAAQSPQKIDFISIDVEGGEISIVEQMVDLKCRFKCGCIEYNQRRVDYERIVSLLDAAGYKVIWEDQTEQDLFFVDMQL